MLAMSMMLIAQLAVMASVLRCWAIRLLSQPEGQTALVDRLRTGNGVDQSIACLALSIVAGCRYGISGQAAANLWANWLQREHGKLEWNAKSHRFIESDLMVEEKSTSTPNESVE
jgi:hypothetical protein